DNHNGHSQINICNVLGHSISCQSLNRWLALYDETWVVQNPDEYEQRGRTMILSTENCEFMIELVRDQPGLFLSEICEQTYNSQGTLMSLQAIHNNLVNKLSITLKKADTVNIRKCLVSKYTWIECMKDVLAKFLVFTDESLVCDHELLHTFAQSSRGLPSQRVIIRQNPEQFSILPAIGIHGPLAISVRMDNYNAKKYERFLKYELVLSYLT
ncbi:hypothetical protein VP01_6295g2, partial [Puccinia sorghi]